MRASNTAELVFDSVTLPEATHLVGKEGDAMLHMMRNLEASSSSASSMIARITFAPSFSTAGGTPGSRCDGSRNRPQKY
jgi:alkylation response protein AidB-like acyl-CoA dehydrogenase